MKRYSDIELETGKLSKDAVIRAGDLVSQIEDSPLWFQLCKMMAKDEDQAIKVLERSPAHVAAAEYAESSGRLAQIRKFRSYFETILSEAEKARESN